MGYVMSIRTTIRQNVAISLKPVDSAPYPSQGNQLGFERFDIQPARSPEGLSERSEECLFFRDNTFRTFSKLVCDRPGQRWVCADSRLETDVPSKLFGPPETALRVESARAYNRIHTRTHAHWAWSLSQVHHAPLDNNYRQVWWSGLLLALKHKKEKRKGWSGFLDRGHEEIKASMQLNKHLEEIKQLNGQFELARWPKIP